MFAVWRALPSYCSVVRLWCSLNLFHESETQGKGSVRILRQDFVSVLPLAKSCCHRSNGAVLLRCSKLLPASVTPPKPRTEFTRSKFVTPCLPLAFPLATVDGTSPSRLPLPDPLSPVFAVAVVTIGQSFLLQ